MLKLSIQYVDFLTRDSASFQASRASGLQSFAGADSLSADSQRKIARWDMIRNVTEELSHTLLPTRPAPEGSDVHARQEARPLHAERPPPTTVMTQVHQGRARAWSWQHFASANANLNTTSRQSAFCTQSARMQTDLTLVVPAPEYARRFLDNARADAHWVYTRKHPRVWINTHAPKISIQSGILHKEGVWDIYIHDTCCS